MGQIPPDWLKRLFTLDFEWEGEAKNLYCSDCLRFPLSDDRYRKCKEENHIIIQIRQYSGTAFVCPDEIGAVKYKVNLDGVIKYQVNELIGVVIRQSRQSIRGACTSCGVEIPPHFRYCSLHCKFGYNPEQEIQPEWIKRLFSLQFSSPYPFRRCANNLYCTCCLQFPVSANSGYHENHSTLLMRYHAQRFYVRIEELAAVKDAVDFGDILTQRINGMWGIYISTQKTHCLRCGFPIPRPSIYCCLLCKFGYPWLTVSRVHGSETS